MLLLVFYDVNVWGVEIWLGVSVGKQSLSLHYSLVLWWDVESQGVKNCGDTEVAFGAGVDSCWNIPC
jgi:hypothetical protein